MIDSCFQNALASMLIVLISTTAAPADVNNRDDPSATRIEQLIERLGAPGYRQRRQAQQELRYIGHRAFDRLLQAQYDSDSEISLAAQQLLSQFTVNWIQPQDASIIGNVMRDYQELPLNLRLERGQWLTQLEDGLGASAIARIVRYEPSELLAKQVALSFLELFDATDHLQTKALEAMMQNTLSNTDRQPAKWLRAFYRDLTQPHDNDNPKTWNKFAKEERDLASGPRSNKAIAASLTQWYASQTFKQKNTDLSEEAVFAIAKLRKGAATEILRTCHWLLDHEQLELFHKFVKQIDDADVQGRLFSYCIAESLLKKGDQKAAEKTALETFKLTTGKEQYFDPISTINERFRTAITLEHRGMTAWSIREYSRIIEQPMRHWIMADRRERSIRLLAELLHDRSRDKEAADTLAKLFEAVETNVFEDNDLDEDTASLVSRMYYFRSQQYRQEANRKRQIDFLRKAIQSDPTDADVLIAMYRLPRVNDAWKADTRRMIKEAVQIFDGKLQRLGGAGVVANRFEIATHLNQVAWLIGNTEGDQQKAIQQSRRSLELRPQSPGSLDTLGQTYFAVGDIENAQKYQRRAVKLEPHSHQIQRQLATFELFAGQGTNSK